MREILTIVLQALANPDAPANLSQSSKGNQTITDERRHFEVAKEVAEQIWREQQITNYRMTWLLTFQGFLLTSSGLTFTSLSAIGFLPSMLTRLVLAGAGIVTTIMTWQSIRASQLQRDELKKIWFKLYPESNVFNYPRPFSVDHSKRGRHAGLWIIVTIVVMWLGLAMLTVYFSYIHLSSNLRGAGETEHSTLVNR